MSIVEDRVVTFREIQRVLKTDGTFYVSSPFVYGELSPVDYCRPTYQGLEKELKEAGFSDIKIIRYGERFTAAVTLLHPFFMFNMVRFGAYGLSLLLDKMIPLGFRTRYPAPCGYFCVIRK